MPKPCTSWFHSIVQLILLYRCSKFTPNNISLQICLHVLSCEWYFSFLCTLQLETTYFTFHRRGTEIVMAPKSGQSTASPTPTKLFLVCCMPTSTLSALFGAQLDDCCCNVARCIWNTPFKKHPDALVEQHSALFDASPLGYVRN